VSETMGSRFEMAGLHSKRRARVGNNRFVFEMAGLHSKRRARVGNDGLAFGWHSKWHLKLQLPFQGLAYAGQRDKVSAVIASAFVLAIDVFWIH